MTLVDDLKAAKALIETPENWAKGDYQPRFGCYCALGACRVAFFGTVSHKYKDTYFADDNPLAKALAAQLPKRKMVHEFNDAPRTKHADIMALFDRAIAAAEASAS